MTLNIQQELIWGSFSVDESHLVSNSYGQHGFRNAKLTCFLIRCLVSLIRSSCHLQELHDEVKISFSPKTVQYFHCLDSICSAKMPPSAGLWATCSHPATCVLLLIPGSLCRGTWLARCRAHLGPKKLEYLNSFVCLIYNVLVPPSGGTPCSYSPLTGQPQG